MPGAPNPATAQAPGYASPLQIAAAWLEAGGPPSQTATAVAVALAESSGQLHATNTNSNGSVDHGLWQINTVNLGPGGVAAPYAANIFDPLANARAAVAVYKSQGWGAWSTYGGMRYKSFAFQAANAAQVATASTFDQLAGALIPLIGVGAAALLPADAAAAGAADSAAAGGASGAGSGALTAAKLATSGDSLLGIGSIAALLTSGSFWLRVLEVIGGVVLVAMGLRSLTGGSLTADTGRVVRAVRR